MKRFVVTSLVAALVGSVASGGAAGAGAKEHNTGQAPKGAHTEATGVSGWAVVDSDGTLARKLNAKSVTPDGTGSYVVRFNSNVRHCAYVGSVGLSGSSGVAEPGYVTVVGYGLDVKGVYVQTFDSGGVLADRGFHLVVQC